MRLAGKLPFGHGKQMGHELLGTKRLISLREGRKSIVFSKTAPGNPHQKAATLAGRHLDAGSVGAAGGSKAATPMPQKRLSSSFPVLKTLPQKSAKLPHPLQSNARSSQDNS